MATIAHVESKTESDSYHFRTPIWVCYDSYGKSIFCLGLLQQRVQIHTQLNAT